MALSVNFDRIFKSVIEGKVQKSAIRYLQIPDQGRDVEHISMFPELVSVEGILHCTYDKASKLPEFISKTKVTELHVLILVPKGCDSLVIFNKIIPDVLDVIGKRLLRSTIEFDVRIFDTNGTVQVLFKKGVLFYHEARPGVNTKKYIEILIKHGSFVGFASHGYFEIENVKPKKLVIYVPGDLSVINNSTVKCLEGCDVCKVITEESCLENVGVSMSLCSVLQLNFCPDTYGKIGKYSEKVRDVCRGNLVKLLGLVSVDYLEGIIDNNSKLDEVSVVVDGKGDVDKLIGIMSRKKDLSYNVCYVVYGEEEYWKGLERYGDVVMKNVCLELLQG